MTIRDQSALWLVPATALLGVAVAAPTGPATVHTTARVDDPLSHGQVGDAKLSLNEAIQLHNGTLMRSQLSAQEQANILGGTDVSIIDIDATIVPAITFERDLDVIVDTAHGCTIVGQSGVPTLDLTATAGIVVQSDFCSFSNLHLRGGRVGLDVTQSNARGALIQDVTCSGQIAAGLRLAGLADDGTSRFFVERVVIDGAGRGIDILDRGKRRTGSFELRDIEVRNAPRGIDILLGEQGASSYTIERAVLRVGQIGLFFQRPASTSDRALDVLVRHVRVVGSVAGATIDGTPANTTKLTLQAVDLTATSVGVALRLGPLGADFDAVIEDSRLASFADLQGGGAGMLLANVHARNGSIVLGASGILQPPMMLDCVLDGTSLSTVGTAAVVVQGSRLIGGAVQGTANAPLRLNGCHVGGTAIGANTTVATPRPAAHLGMSDVMPPEPAIGTTAMLTADLPAGLRGLWFVGLTDFLPSIGRRPLHIYVNPFFMVRLPTSVRGQSATALPVPNNPFLIGTDLFCQLVVVPDAGVAAPPLTLPPGRRVVPR